MTVSRGAQSTRTRPEITEISWYEYYLAAGPRHHVPLSLASHLHHTKKPKHHALDIHKSVLMYFLWGVDKPICLGLTFGAMIQMTERWHNDWQWQGQAHEAAHASLPVQSSKTWNWEHGVTGIVKQNCSWQYFLLFVGTWLTKLSGPPTLVFAHPTTLLTLSFQSVYSTLTCSQPHTTIFCCSYDDTGRHRLPSLLSGRAW